MENISGNEEHIHAAHDQEQATSVPIHRTITSGPATEIDIASTPLPQTVNFSRRLTKKRYSNDSQTSSPPTPPTAIHPALRPISVFSRSSSAESTRTSGYAYDSMSSGSRPSTSWTIGQGYESMRPGILPNMDWTTRLSYEEMKRGESCVAGSSKAESSLMGEKKKSRGFLRGYKEELKQNFKAMDRAFSQY